MKKSAMKKKRSKTKFKNYELRDIILSIIGLSILIGGTYISPGFPLVMGTIMNIIQEEKNKPATKQQVKRVLKSLEKRNLINLERKNDEVYVHLTERHHDIILKYSLKELLVIKKKEKQWKGKWYLIIFDIPELERKKRDYLRRFLNEIGFYHYQQSVYLYPFECEKEIALIKKIVEGGKYISYVRADKIENETQAKIYFNLS